MDHKYFLSDNPKVLADAIKQVIYSDKSSDKRKKMQEGIDYYTGKHAILGYRLFFTDNDGKVVEDRTRSNIKIPHQFFTELVDQKTQYLLSNPIEITTEQEGLQDYLDEYIDEEFQQVLQELVEGAAQKSHEYVYVRRDDRLRFASADSMKVIEIHDDKYERIAVVRYYETDLFVDGRNVRVTRAELWDNERVWFFVNGGQNNPQFVLDEQEVINPRPHETFVKGDEVIGKGLGYIPFFRFDNNRQKQSDLVPVKRLIDDYDLMACSLSNNLQDFDQPFFAVKGFNGGGYDELINNLRARGSVGVDKEGGLEVHTVQIPYEARKVKLEVDKEAIYKFGMGFDSSQVGDGNITNVVIKSRYSLLDLKCDKTEKRLRVLLKKLLKLIVEDINTRFGTSYTHEGLEITITRDTMVNERDVSEIAQIEALAQQTKVNTIIAAATYLDSDSVLRLMCEALDLSFEEVSKAVEDDEPFAVEGGANAE